MGLSNFLGNLLSPQYRNNMAGADQSNFNADINQIKLLRNTTSASPSATSPARSTYVNNQTQQQQSNSSTPPSQGGLILNGQAVPQGVNGIDYENSLSQQGNTGTANTSTSKAPAKSAYISYLEKIFDPKALDTANASLNDLNKRTSEELLRARSNEDTFRKNQIGQLENGVNYSLDTNARESNKSLADLALSKGYQQDYVNRILGAGQELNTYQQEQNKPVSVSAGESLVQYNPETGQYETKYQAPVSASDPYKGLPSSAQEYLFALQNGYQGSYQDYQNEDANRKRSVSNTYVNSGTGLNPYQTFQAQNTIQDNARQDADISVFPQIRGAYEQAQSAASQGNSLGDIVLMRTIAKITDPTSSVREEEYNTFQNAIGTLPRYGVLLTSNMVGKGQLTESGRKAILDQISKIYNQRAAAYQSKIDYYNNQAAPYGGSVPSYTAPNNNDPLGLGL